MSTLIILEISAYLEGSEDNLSLLPAEFFLIKLVGEDNLWYVLCQAQAQHPKYTVNKCINNKEGLDLVESVKQGYGGEYICVQTENPGSRVQFDLVVVQPIDYGDTPSTQMVKV